MKRKAQRVPDFSTAKRPPAGGKTGAPQQTDKPATAQRTVVKPQATSSKSGRRGQ